MAQLGLSAILLLLLLRAALAQEEERCEDFGSCLTECAKKLPPSHTYMDIIDCSDKCVVSHCKEVNLKPIVNPPGRGGSSAPPPPSGGGGGRSNPPPQGSSKKQQRDVAEPEEASVADFSVLFLRPLPGEIFPDGTGAIHFQIDGTTPEMEGKLETDITVNGMHALDSKEKSLAFRLESLEEGVHNFEANTLNTETGEVSKATVKVRSVAVTSHLLDFNSAIAVLDIPLQDREETIMIRQDVGQNENQLGLRCSRDGSWIDIPLPASTLDTIMQGLTKRFTRIYGVSHSVAIATQVRQALEEILTSQQEQEQ